MKVLKAVIPVAGLGTRMLPATKAIPKEMLPVLRSTQLLIHRYLTYQSVFLFFVVLLCIFATRTCSPTTFNEILT